MKTVTENTLSTAAKKRPNEVLKNPPILLVSVGFLHREALYTDFVRVHLRKSV
jgi:hypothetical protein